jgi:ribosome-interacting GTPase 1
MDQLQSKHFDLVKKINDDETKLRAVEIELEQLAKELEGLDQVDVESQEEMDKDAIAVGLFRKMGFVPCYLRNDSSQVSTDFESLMVRSDTKNRSTEFEVNDDMMKAKAITPYILANQLWQASE